MNKFKHKTSLNIGKRFGKLVVKNYVSRKYGYSCVCDCGIEIMVSITRLTSGDKTSCGCERKSKLGHPVLADNMGAKNYFKCRYIASARKRNIPYELTDDEFYSIINQHCYYCGLEPAIDLKLSAHPLYRCTGVDRLDNTLGYTASNCVPCCTQCNTAKMSMTVTQWYSWLNRIFKFQKDLGTFND